MYLRYVGNLPTCDVFSRLHHTHLLALLVWFFFVPLLTALNTYVRYLLHPPAILT